MPERRPILLENTMQSENNHWLERWESNNIQFHDADINPALITYFSHLHLPTNSTILVPLCGKSKDLLWLEKQGYQVIGIELSPIACHDFFNEQNIKPLVHHEKPFTVYQHGKITIFCGDLFQLNKGNLPRVDAIYDCKALIALPPERRKQYVEHLIQCTGNNVSGLLITLESSTSIIGPPFPIDAEEVNQLYKPYFTVQQIQRKPDVHIKNHLVQKGLTEKIDVVYLLKRHGN